MYFEINIQPKIQKQIDVSNALLLNCLDIVYRHRRRRDPISLYDIEDILEITFQYLSERNTVLRFTFGKPVINLANYIYFTFRPLIKISELTGARGSKIINYGPVSPRGITYYQHHLPYLRKKFRLDESFASDIAERYFDKKESDAKFRSDLLQIIKR